MSITSILSYTETSTTSTSTTTTTTSPIATETVTGPFRIRASGGNVDGQYLTDQQRNPQLNLPYFSTSPAGSSAVTCTINSGNRGLICEGLETTIYGCGQFFEISQPSFYGGQERFKLKCDVAETGQLMCDTVQGSSKPSSQWYSCTSAIVGGVSQNYLMQGVYCENNCVPISVYAEVL